jgi:signal transduction histidine kinase
MGLLGEVAEAHRAVAREKGVSLEVDAGDQVGPASLDPERLSIALANLVSNAIRHTPAGGEVRLGAMRADGVLRIRVTDTGEGMAAEELGRIFDRPSSGPGSGRHGLGLTIAREIVLQHGGEISAESAPGRGSVFTLMLPAEERK